MYLIAANGKSGASAEGWPNIYSRLGLSVRFGFQFSVFAAPFLLRFTGFVLSLAGIMSPDLGAWGLRVSGS